MPILFDWYENPQAPNLPKKERYHARISRTNGKMSTDEVVADIHRRCTLTEPDIKAVLTALSVTMGDGLSYGRRIHLEGLGYFSPTLECTEPIKADTKRRTPKVKFKTVRFRPDKELRKNIDALGIKMERNKYSGHSEKLSEVEIDIRLKEYFATHERLTRWGLQEVCNMTRSQAHIHLRRLLEAGKILNLGQTYQPIYVAAPGFYGRSKNT
jgi:predicted histone-like DNA-binding protein